MSVSVKTYDPDGQESVVVALAVTPAEAGLLLSQRGEIISLGGRMFFLQYANLGITDIASDVRDPIFHVSAEGMYQR